MRLNEQILECIKMISRKRFNKQWFFLRYLQKIRWNNRIFFVCWNKKNNQLCKNSKMSKSVHNDWSNTNIFAKKISQKNKLIERFWKKSIKRSIKKYNFKLFFKKKTSNQTMFFWSKKILFCNSNEWSCRSICYFEW